jgi:hypothetical protein
MSSYKPAQILAFLIEQIGYQNRLQISERNLQAFLAANCHKRLRVKKRGEKVIFYLA